MDDPSLLRSSGVESSHGSAAGKPESPDGATLMRLQPLDWWLTIPDEELHKEFLRCKTGTWVATDATVYLCAILYCLVKLWTWEHKDLVATVLHHTWFATSCIVLPSVFLLTIKHRPNVYAGLRMNLMTGFRVSIAAGFGLLFSAIKAHDLWIANATLFQRLVTQTPVLAVANLSLHVLPFKRHVWVQLIGIAVSSTWVGDLCASTKTSQQLETSINHIGWHMDCIFQRLSVLGLPVATSPLMDGEFSCWLVGFFTHILLGFIVPTLGFYIAEVISKINFLRRRNRLDWKTLKVIKMSRIMSACVMALVGSQCAWVVLKGLLSRKCCSPPTNNPLELLPQFEFEFEKVDSLVAEVHGQPINDL